MHTSEQTDTSLITLEPTYCSSDYQRYVCEDAALHTVPLYHLQQTHFTINMLHQFTAVLKIWHKSIRLIKYTVHHITQEAQLLHRPCNASIH